MGRHPEGLHVAIEATGVKHGGGAHVLLRLLDAMLADARIGRVTLFVSEAPDRLFITPASEELVLVEPPLIESAPWRVIWLEAGLAEQCARLKPDVVLCFNGLGYVRPGTPQINLLQQPLLFRPKVLGQMPISFRLRMEVIRKLTRASCARADLVLVQTPTVAALASSLFGLSLSKLKVHLPDVRWQEPALISPRIRQMSCVPADRRVLYVGSTIEYKRVDVIARAVRRLAEYRQDLTLFATIPKDHPVARMDHVEALGADLSPGEVRACMELATTLAMPSLAETVGLPMLEAMSVGCPVLASNLAYVHDVCEDAALCFLPGNVRSCLSRLDELLVKPALREDLAKRGLERTEALRAAAPYAAMVDDICALLAPGAQAKREARDDGQDRIPS